MRDNRYYTLKDMVIVLVLLLLIIIVALHNSCYLCYLSQKNKQLQEKVESLELRLSTYEFVPDWLIMSYDRCNCPEVPENFLKDCVAYEIKSKN